MSVQNVTAGTVSVGVSGISGMADNNTQGSNVSAFNTTVGPATGFPSPWGGPLAGQYIESSGLLSSSFKLQFTDAAGGLIGAITLSESNKAYTVSAHDSAGLLLVSINNSGEQATIVIIVLGVPFRPATWLTDFTAFSNLPIAKLCLPGTHDSGAWTTSLAAGVGIGASVLTQSTDIANQLAAGARYFDIRPSLGSDGVLYHGHGRINCAPLSKILNDIAAFASSHPKELVFLNFSHMDANALQPAWDAITSTLGNFLVASSNDSATVGAIQSTNKSVFVFFDRSSNPVDWKAYGQFQRDPNLTLAQWNNYANADSASTLITWMQQLLGSQPAGSPFWLLQCQLTQTDLDAIMDGAALVTAASQANTLPQLAAQSKGPVQALLDISQSPKSALAQQFARTSNFFIVDFFDPSWTRLALVANLYKLSQS
jgi:hypothetical protein